jgi:uncharacterized protein (DUF2344 family)
LKKLFQILIFIILCLLNFGKAFSQDNYGKNPEKCQKNLSNLFKYSKAENYDLAYESWKWCFENCPSANVNIYYFGLKIANDKYEKGDKEAVSKLIDTIYTQRIKYFPNNLGRVYSNWATSLEKRGVTKEKVFEKLELGFKADPSGLSIKNIAKYFQEVTDRNKNTNVKKVFDTYDDIIEAVNVKIDKLTKELDKINAKDTTEQILTSKEKRKQKNNTINLRVLGRAEDVLNQILGEVTTCDRLIPLYDKNFNAHKTDVKWLKRAVSRLYHKECIDNTLFKKLLEAYAKVDYSPEVLIIYKDILGNKISYNNMNELNKLINSVKDPYQKADYYYKIARTMYGSQARTYARRALKHRPSMGKAYLLIARLYAKSANKCGEDEFSKRMVFVAAVDKARKAKEVDPSVTAIANKYIKSYTASFPLRRTCGFPGKNTHLSNTKKEFHIKCWIGETVIIP